MSTYLHYNRSTRVWALRRASRWEPTPACLPLPLPATLPPAQGVTLTQLSPSCPVPEPQAPVGATCQPLTLDLGAGVPWELPTTPAHEQKGPEIALSTPSPCSLIVYLHMFIYSHLIPKDARQPTETQPKRREYRGVDRLGSERAGLGSNPHLYLLIFAVESLHLSEPWFPVQWGCWCPPRGLLTDEMRNRQGTPGTWEGQTATGRPRV